MDELVSTVRYGEEGNHRVDAKVALPSHAVPLLYVAAAGHSADAIIHLELLCAVWNALSIGGLFIIIEHNVNSLFTGVGDILRHPIMSPS